jgi:demethylmenaquinone methyltransferase / 2-methoxy-6-polyprenyl-1,4-benzoquinol methylase
LYLHSPDVPSRRPGLQGRWKHVFDSLESMVPIYEIGSSRIALFSDETMRERVVRFAVSDDALVLDLGSGPGMMAELVSAAGGRPVLVDASRRMLSAAKGVDKVQAVYENLPFRDSAFGSVVAGFSLRDSRDLITALGEVRRAVAENGRFGFCDLGKSDSFPKAVILGFYLRTVVPVVGAMTGGRAGLGFGSLYDTYVLTLTNGKLSTLLSRYFSHVEIESSNLGGSIVVSCTV